MPPLGISSFPFAANVRSLEKGIVGPRPPLSNPTQAGGSGSPISVGAPIHSLRVLSDSTPDGPAFGFAYVFGASTNLYVGNTLVAFGFSGNRLSMVSYRPNASIRPWMYIGDSIRGVKVDASGDEANIGIAEPQSPVLIVTSTASATGPTVPAFYRVKYRSSLTGAVSNPSPPMRVGFNVASTAPTLSMTASPDPQVDVMDWYRQDVGLLSYTYIGTSPNGNNITDNVSDAAASANPQMEFDDFEPFPSIDLPRKFIGTVTGPNQITWASGDQFNGRWLPGTLLTSWQPGLLYTTTYTLYNRPTSATILTVYEDLTPFLGNLIQITIAEPILAAQRLPSWWGPTDNTGFFFAVGDKLRPGTLYFTKGNNPDSAPDTNQIEVTSPSEPLMNGCLISGLGMVFSTQHAWLIYPQFAGVVSTVTGTLGSPFTLVQSISQRGLLCPQGLCTDGGAKAYFISLDGVYVTTGFDSKNISEQIWSMFPHEGTTPQSVQLQGVLVPPPDGGQGMALSFSDGRLYLDYSVPNASVSLVYDERIGWSVDIYSPIVTVHSPFGNSSATLVGCVDGTIRSLSTIGTETVTMILQTDYISHGLPDWESLLELNLQYASPVTILLSFTPDQGIAINSITVPASLSGNSFTASKWFTKVGVGKFKLLQYGLTLGMGSSGETGVPRIWLDGFQAKVGEWQRTDNATLNKPLNVFLSSKSEAEAEVQS